MRLVIQRVLKASVEVDGQIVGEIGQGFLVFAGFCEEDDEAVADRMLKKMAGLRIFEDDEGKTNRSLADVGGALLLVSQFTLYADCRKGNRPSFINAAKPEKAEALYEYLLAKARESIPVVQQGIFGAEMKISLLNDGPFTILLDSEDLVGPRR